LRPNDQPASGTGAPQAHSAGRGPKMPAPSAPGAYNKSAGSSSFKSNEDRVRLPNGTLPDALVPVLEAVMEAADAWLVHLAAIARVLKAEMKDKPEDARRLSNFYAHMGTLAPRLEAVADTTRLLLSGLEAGDTPVAKWFTFDVRSDGLNPIVHIQAHACPTLPGTVLRQLQLPSQVPHNSMSSESRNMVT